MARLSSLVTTPAAILLLTIIGGCDSTEPDLNAPSRLAFAVAPSPVTAGAIIAPSVVVAVLDASGAQSTGSSASITLSITGGTGVPGALLGGTLTRAAVNGVATFNDLTLDKAGAGYTLTASSGSLTGAASTGFAVTPSVAASLEFTIQPSSVAAGAPIAPGVAVSVLDAFGNAVTTSTANVTVAIATGTGAPGATLGGTLTKSAVSGVATFENLTLDTSAGGYALTAMATGLTSATSDGFAVGAGTPTLLVISAQPTNATAGAAIAPPVVVVVKDALGNIVTSSAASITMGLTTGTGTAGAILSGTLTKSAVAGVATFNDLALDKAGAGYSLTATSGGIATATTNGFAIAPGAASKLIFTTQPSPVAAGVMLNPAVIVEVVDGLNNTVVGTTASISLAITGGTGTAGAILGGTVARNAVNGTATFDNLTIDKAGANYTLTAAATGLAGAVSSSFAVSPGVATQLSFTVQPSNVGAGSSITPPVQVTLLDGFGNTATGSGASVTLAITSGTGTAGAILSGTLAAPPSSGVATFGNLKVDRLGTGYTLRATASGMPPETSGAFTVQIGAATSVAAERHSCAANAAGLVYCWGLNDAGQLGDGTTSNRVRPVPVLGGLVFPSIASGLGEIHTCGLTAGGAAYCWGGNNFGQLGTGSTSWSSTPTAVAGSLVFKSLTSGSYHTCALTTAGAAYCWGDNRSGQLGIGSSGGLGDYRESPVPVLGGHTFQSLSAGSYQTCGVTTSGAAYCWGANLDGQLGNGTVTASSSPVAVSGGIMFSELAGGWRHTCGVTPSGAAYCWGNNASGGLGDGTTNSTTLPTAVAGGLTFELLSAGRINHTCGLTTAGIAYCWGDNSSGGLGNGTMSNSSTPSAVLGGHAFKALGVGYYNACGLLTTGAAYCWGDNTYGALGDGTTTNRYSPVAVADF